MWVVESKHMIFEGRALDISLFNIQRLLGRGCSHLRRLILRLAIMV